MNVTYAERVSQQINQFANTSALWKLPPIYSYWSQKFIVPRLQAVSGYRSIFDAYFAAIADAAKKKAGKRAVLYSIGAGDCNVEITLAERLHKASIDNARIVCLELSPLRLLRAERQASSKQVSGLMEFRETDLNNWEAEEPVDVFIAHHTLHHLVELEIIYSAIYNAMTDESIFITADMIGRNGHQRWPEALLWIERLWRIMPDRYKLNFQFGAVHEDYLNWDCSKSGFEGIRAQDVLPLLVERFDFDWFLGYGGIIDPFVERGYGQNFDVGNEKDTGFIDFLENLNQTLLEAGQLTPTIMMAAFKKGQGGRKFFSNISPAGSIRRV